MQALQIANPTCADCGASTPDWASINLGLLLCIECSGIHRAMGVHLSKVRSVTLDRWSYSLKKMMGRLGNKLVNSVLEAELDRQSGWKRPLPDSCREEKEKFARAKYQFKGFVNVQSEEAAKSDSSKEEDVCEVLARAASNGDFARVVHMIARGVDVNTKSEKGQGTALHLVADEGRVAMVELLLQNGGTKSLDILDKDGLSPLDRATMAGHAAIVDLLLERLGHR